MCEPKEMANHAKGIKKKKAQKTPQTVKAITSWKPFKKVLLASFKELLFIALFLKAFLVI